MTNSIQLHDNETVKVRKTTQTNADGRQVEQVNIEADNMNITLFGASDPNSDKDKTVNLEVTE